MIDMCPSYRPTMNSNMSSISLYNNLSRFDSVKHSPNISIYTLRKNPKQSEAMLFKTKLMNNNNNLRIRKKVLELSSLIENDSTKREKKKIINIEEYLRFSATKKNVIKGGLMKRIIDKHESDKNSSIHFKKRQFELTKRRDRENSIRYINELKDVSNRIKSELYK